MSSQYITRTVEWTSNGTAHSTEMIEAQFATRGRSSWRKWYNCHICGLSYPEDEVVLRGGIAFCIPLGDYKDMNDPRS